MRTNTMKRAVFIMVMALTTAFMYAQEKGDMGVGANLNFGTDGPAFGIGGKFQWNITDAIRLEPGVSYYFKSDYTSMLDVNVNVNYLFPVAENINVYPLAGLSVVNIKYDFDVPKTGVPEFDSYVSDSKSNTEIGFNLGGGAEYKFTENLAAFAEIKFQIVNNYNRAIFSLGVAYKF